MTDATVPPAPTPPRARSPWPARRKAIGEFWFTFRQNRGAVIGLVVFALLILIAVFAPLIAPFGFDQIFYDHFRTPPAWQEGGVPQFLLGTDGIGRDVLSRLIYGARYSLLIGVVVVVLSLLGGVLLGLVAGYFGGKTDIVIMRVMDVILSFPSILLALVLVAILGPSLMNAMIAVAVVLQPHFARLARAAVRVEKSRDYVTSAQVAGASHLRQMFVTILPNIFAPLIVQATLSFSTAVLEAAALGFLGVGAQPPTPEWGAMLAADREFILTDWWLATFPGLAILITVFAVNLVGDGLRDALDPRLKRS
ncbi:MAG: ABC transporter permease subunit [Bauldia sp.]|nr:ABC transporter permease subunit [Bauldia sp.]